MKKMILFGIMLVSMPLQTLSSDNSNSFVGAAMFIGTIAMHQYSHSVGNVLRSCAVDSKPPIQLNNQVLSGLATENVVVDAGLKVVHHRQDGKKVHGSVIFHEDGRKTIRCIDSSDDSQAEDFFRSVETSFPCRRNNKDYQESSHQKEDSKKLPPLTVKNPSEITHTSTRLHNFNDENPEAGSVDLEKSYFLVPSSSRQNKK